MVLIPAILHDQLDALRDLCRRHHVAQLEVFGSAASGEFNERSSDLDFLVQFGDLSPRDRGDAYFGLLADLQDLFRRPIDLVETEAVDNPYFKDSIEPSRRVLYAAGRAEVPA
jgi:predicted nucleotidyltransferase